MTSLARATTISTVIFNPFFTLDKTEMSAAEAVRKTRLQVRCRAIDEDELKQEPSDTVRNTGR